MVGLDFSATFDHVNHKTVVFKLKQLRVGGFFLNILTEFLSSRLQTVVSDGQSNEYRNAILSILHGIIF